jgi:uncharacterized lipoprotein YmbA
MVLCLVFITLLSVTAIGCLSRPAMHKRTYAFDTPSIGSTTTDSSPNTSVPVLAIKSVIVAAPFDGPSFVYRTAPQSFERDPYALFLVPPGRSLSETIRSRLRLTGAFADVLENQTGQPSEVEVEVTIRELFGDFSPGRPPAAVLSGRFVFLDGNRRRIWQTDQQRRIPLNERTAQAVMSGWDQAIAEIVADVGSGFTLEWHRTENMRFK